jgi:hypothetical protein
MLDEQRIEAGLFVGMHQAHAQLVEERLFVRIGTPEGGFGDSQARFPSRGAGECCAKNPIPRALRHFPHRKNPAYC